MKGIGILLVMLGHTNMFRAECTIPDWLYISIETFHVPMFFIIAGYFSKSFDNDWCAVIGKYFKRLVIPFLWTALIVIAYNTILSIKRNDSLIIKGILGSFLIGDTSQSLSSFFGFPFDMGVGPVWFLMALFWAKSIYYFISRYKVEYTCAICLGISYVMSLINLPLPFFLKQGVTALGFVAIGALLNKHKLPIWLGVLSIVCFFIVQFIPLRLSPYMASYPLYPVNFVAACGGAYLVYWISKGILNIPYINGLLTIIGNNTMNILCAHSIDMRCNLFRIVLKHIPIINTMPWLFVGTEYFIVLMLSYIPYKIRKMT